MINGETNTVIDTIDVGATQFGVTFDPDNGYLYFANCYSGTVSIISSTSKTKDYPVKFTESLLFPGTSWFVVLNGVTQNFTDKIITFFFPDGSYQYIVNSVSGYSVSPSSGSFIDNGYKQAVNVSFKHTNTPSTLFQILGIDPFILIGIVVAVEVIAYVVVVMRKRKFYRS